GPIKGIMLVRVSNLCLDLQVLSHNVLSKSSICSYVSFLVIFSRGCMSAENCKKMQVFEPSTRCCSTDHCN
uniref:Uncharacterized protein n=1 Tax=Leptobrachium leishanense TaxID=445787 RepID=A0A8C5R214_9ANUR